MKDIGNRIDKYCDAIMRLPSSGGGLHSSLLGIANLGIIAGVEPNRIREDLREATDNCSKGRVVRNREIEDAIRAAQRDCLSPEQYQQQNIKYRIRIDKPTPLILPQFTHKLIKSAKDIATVDLWEASPVRLLEEAANDWKVLITALFKRDDEILVGSLYDKRLVNCEVLLAGYETTEFICPNPFTGEPAKTKESKPSLHCDAAVKEFRYCIVEFDNIPVEEQIKFWSAIALPISALIYSGNKSVHAWIDIRDMHITNIKQWKRCVVGELFTKRLKPLGVDIATSNPSRTSRMPSYMRDTGKIQQLLYLNPSPTGMPIVTVSGER